MEIRTDTERLETELREANSRIKELESVITGETIDLELMLQTMYVKIFNSIKSDEDFITLSGAAVIMADLLKTIRQL